MKRILILAACALFIGVLCVQAQSEQDAQFLKKFNPGTELVNGKTYLFELEKQLSSPEHNKSMFLKAESKPEFNRRGEVTNGEPYASFKDKTLVYKGSKQDKVTIDDKERLCLVVQFTCDGKKYNVYETEYANPRPLTYYKLVEADILNEIRKQLVGKTLYTRTSSWWKFNADKVNSNLKYEKVTNGVCKFCPVTITRIESDYKDKFIVMFRKEGQSEELCFNNVTFDSKKIGETFSFDRYMTFENPQKNYPNISQENWEQIMNMKVKQGFAPEEVKVAYGEPDETFTENDDEVWVYINIGGKDYAVFFKDNVVDKVRSQSTTYF